MSNNVSKNIGTDSGYRDWLAKQFARDSELERVIQENLKGIGHEF